MLQNGKFPDKFSAIADFLSWWFDNPVLDPVCQKIFDSYYASYKEHFGDYIRAHYNNQTYEIQQLIGLRPRQRLLEIGSGCGTEAIWFAMCGAEVTSIDVNFERLQVAMARKAYIESVTGMELNLTFQLCSVFDHRVKEPYDLIWMEQTFHHIEPRSQVYEVISRLLAPGCHVVISEANAWNPLIQIALFWRRGINTVVHKEGPLGQQILYGNERIILPFMLKRGFDREGVEALSTRFFRTLPNIRGASSLWFLERLLPSFAAPVFTHFNYVGRKASA
jgi:SAM-dependent methyltransferase